MGFLRAVVVGSHARCRAWAILYVAEQTAALIVACLPARDRDRAAHNGNLRLSAFARGRMMVVSLPVNISIGSSDEIASSEIDWGRINRVVHAQVNPMARNCPCGEQRRHLQHRQIHPKVHVRQFGIPKV